MFLDYPRLIARAIDRGAWVHALSDFVADEVREFFPIDPDRVVTIHLGVKRNESQGDPTRGVQLAGADRYVLAIGTIEPRKGLPTLVRAFDKVAASDPELRLVIAGPDGWGADQLDAALVEISHGDRVVRTGWVSDLDRRALLAGATMLAYPSIYEGFGFPPLEAMSAGIPVAASSAGPLPEVLGEAALLIEPGDIGSWADAIQTLCTDERTSRQLVGAGRVRVERYPWHATVTKAIDMYRHAAE